MSRERTLFRCKIIDDTPTKALIQADIGQAWFDRSEFDLVHVGFADDVDEIKIDFDLAIERGIV